jgi:type I restriction enzyme M protein
MVRLSLVNLYLHGFTDPHVYEYDTLTSEERWHEFADVILANPPFMSPKGGIKPHKRFGIQAKRSEVLFVDYMAEHLTPTGRAAIIVPEGIIFQSQTAYKELRKMLVENTLVAVVSLPAGCFQPYSGVKTSILILDKSLARQSDTVAFFKVENDGFGLGAQRRAIEKNDLPQVQAELSDYLGALRSGTPIDSVLAATSTAQIVAKKKLAANGDYNLSGERYREGALSSHEYPLVKIGAICAINPSKREALTLPPETQVSFVPMSDLNEHQMSFTPREKNPSVKSEPAIPPFKTATFYSRKSPRVSKTERPESLAASQTASVLAPVSFTCYARETPLWRSGFISASCIRCFVTVPSPR